MKKKFKPLQQVKGFIERQSDDIKAEYELIVNKLQYEGKLSMPFGEKVDSSLFAIRVIRAGNIRVFYLYGKDNRIYGIYGYVKKTRTIPLKEINFAKKISKLLKREGKI